MIQRLDYDYVVGQAYQSISQFSADYPPSAPHAPGHLPKYDGLCELVGDGRAGDADLGNGSRPSMAAFFAASAAGVNTIPWEGLPELGFVSWIMAYPEKTIVVDYGEIDRCRVQGGQHPDTQAARTILHEVGHIKLRPYFLTKCGISTEPPARTADFWEKSLAAEEEAAWVFGWVVLSVILGDYALVSRIRGEGDPSPNITV